MKYLKSYENFDYPDELFNFHLKHNREGDDIENGLVNVVKHMTEILMRV